MRAVVVGGSGQIGGWLLHWLRRSGHEAFGTYNSVPMEGLDPLGAGRIKAAVWYLRRRRPDVVFYPAGFTWVDGCERDPARAFAANRDEPLMLARAAAADGARFVYFSSDYVFDGAAGPYDETAAPNPLSVYGRAKLEAERELAAHLGDAQLTIRTTWVIGPERQGKNFAYQVVRSLRQGRPVVCPSDMASTPSYAPDVARAAVLLAESGHAGLIHVAGPEMIGRADLARAIARAFGLEATGITERLNRDIPQDAARPLKGGLKTPRLDQLAPGVMRPLADCLAEFRSQVEAAGSWLHPLFS
jgi:dTDP-4-dehydrorhamnose reductase